MMEDLFSDCQQRWIPSNLKLLTSAERRLHVFERKLEQELKDQYHYFMRKSKGLDHRDLVNSQEEKKHPTIYQSLSLKGNKFHNNARIIMESNN